MKRSKVFKGLSADDARLMASAIVRQRDCEGRVWRRRKVPDSLMHADLDRAATKAYRVMVRANQGVYDV